MSMATLYIVATPIGNLGDMTLRALEVLKEVDIILCEDTRVTKKLLNHYGIKKETLSYHSHSGLTKVNTIINLLTDGKNLALVSDAGTPGISDPGTVLVGRVREEVPGAKIIVIPGPSALTAALSLSGFPSSDFLFLGFLPHKKGREKLFKEITVSARTSVFYESPHRILKTLSTLAQYLGENRHVAVARELTKIYESFVFGSPGKVLQHFVEHIEEQRGEFVLMVAGASKSTEK